MIILREFQNVVLNIGGVKMSEKRFQKTRIVDKWGGIYDSQTDRILDVNDVEHKLNEQQAIIDKQELRLQCIEELLELSENLNKSYREKLIDMNLKMVMYND